MDTVSEKSNFIHVKKRQSTNSLFSYFLNLLEEEDDSALLFHLHTSCAAASARREAVEWHQQTSCPESMNLLLLFLFYDHQCLILFLFFCYNNRCHCHHHHFLHCNTSCKNNKAAATMLPRIQHLLLPELASPSPGKCLDHHPSVEEE